MYRLEELLKAINADAGVDNGPTFDLSFKGELCTLAWKYDIQPLTTLSGEVSNHMMEWTRLWLNPRIEDVKCFICSPYLVSILNGFCKSSPNENYEVFIDFVHDKYPNWPDLELKTLLVPYTCGSHWTLFVLGENGFFHFDSSADCGLRSNLAVHVRLAKMWATRSGYDEQSDMWRKAQEP